ncbi:hypothetical protein MKX08_000168 [Trichoderma sp. CBMAI-0020]|nr:hypothetical protein MKX08_000168 [Trichoderma sp. CBMAI-0020]
MHSKTYRQAPTVYIQQYWSIAKEIRPLRLRELAVATTISSSQNINLQDLELDMPLSISRYLQCLNGTLIKISDLRVLPGFAELDRTTEEAKHEYNFIILGKCIDYLKMILKIAKLQEGKVENFHEIFYRPEYEFMEYTVIKWPQHYARTNKDSSADINYKGPKGTALERRIARRDSAFIMLFLEHKADVDISSKEIIFLMLLAKGAQLALKDPWGRGPLSTAIAKRVTELLPYLLGHPDVDVNERDTVGRTPLMLAVRRGVYVINDLRYHGADINAQDRWGRTALIYAIMRDDGSMVEELLSSGAALGLKDIRGRDALYWAAEQSYLFYDILRRIKNRDGYHQSLQHVLNAAIALDAQTLAEQLLEFLVPDLCQTDDNGWTICDTAARYENQGVKTLIEKAAGWMRQTPLGRRLEPIKIPTRWHPLDLSPALKIDHEGNGSRRFAIGFCDEHTPLGGAHLGRHRASWGYRGPTWTHTPSEEVYGKGDVIGWGVDFTEEVAFYTLNGEIIGK